MFSALANAIGKVFGKENPLPPPDWDGWQPFVVTVDTKQGPKELTVHRKEIALRGERDPQTGRTIRWFEDSDDAERSMYEYLRELAMAVPAEERKYVSGIQSRGR